MCVYANTQPSVHSRACINTFKFSFQLICRGLSQRAANEPFELSWMNWLTFFLKMSGLLIGFLYKIQSKQVWAKCFSCMKSTFRSEKNRSLWRKVDFPFDFILSTLAYQTTILCDTKYPTLCERAGFPHRSSEHTQSFCLGRFYAVVRISF